MASSRPLAGGGLFTTPADMYGGFDEEPDDTLILHRRGSNQFLGHDANHHEDASTVGARGNRVQAGQLPRTQSAPVSSPNRANPLGSEKSLNG